MTEKRDAATDDKVTREGIEQWFEMHGYPRYTNSAIRDLAIKGLALSEIATLNGMSVEELNYLLISTAPDGQWADQAVHSYCTAIRARIGDTSSARCVAAAPLGTIAALHRIRFGMYSAQGYLRVSGKPEFVLDLVNGAIEVCDSALSDGERPSEK